MQSVFPKLYAKFRNLKNGEEGQAWSRTKR